MTAWPSDAGVRLAIGRRRPVRPMRENGLRGRQERRFKRTTDSEHARPVAPTIIGQDVTATAPNQTWGVDISSVWTRDGSLCLAVAITLFSRRVVGWLVGWAVGDRLHRDLALAAVRTALVMRRPPEGLIQHANRASQCWSVDDQAELKLPPHPDLHAGHGKPLQQRHGRGVLQDNQKPRAVQTNRVPLSKCLST